MALEGGRQAFMTPEGTQGAQCWRTDSLAQARKAF